MFVGLTERVGYVPGGTNVGVVRLDERHVLLVDTGLNDTTARKVLRVVRNELASEVVLILNTHGHADHFGANAFVTKRTGAQVIAPGIESAVIENPVLQPAMLYGGADPLDALRNRFLLAEASAVHRRIEPGILDIEGTSVEVIGLDGHSPNQVGLVVDGVFFCADVVLPDAAIEKYRIPYLYALTAHLASLDRSLAIQSTAVVPGHGPHATNIDALVALNRQAIDRVIDCVLTSLERPTSADDVCTAVFSDLDVPVTDAQGYYLLRPTMNAYLAHLERQGAVRLEIDQHRALWRRT
jgi:glyoxylase-like metal-dependent hydrolase (beta-lactamase superfamily II)